MRLLLPKTYVDPQELLDPLFFLGGPIKGGDDWQAQAAELLTVRVPNCVVINPCRYPESHPLYRFRLSGVENEFPHQTLWERWYLELAAYRHEPDRSCLIFWLPRESKTNPRTDGSPYGRETYGEIGEWRGRLIGNSIIRMVVGAEAGFPGLKQIRINFEAVVGKKFTIYPTLQDTIDAAIKLARC